jgi:thiamine kinase-like enzyme
MENKEFYLESIDKNKYSESNSDKFKIVKCQQLVDNNTNTTTWIYLEDIIKKEFDLKIMKGILLHDYPIVVKIGKKDTIEKEYNISKILSNIPCFITYLCYLPASGNCNNNIHKIITNSSICAKDGELLKILVMKEYPLGNLKNFNWNKENFNILKSLLKQIFASLFLAYTQFSFIHNDVHFGNFLIKKTSEERIEYKNIGSIKIFGYYNKRY